MRPTLSLAMIMKNEAHNIPHLFQSIEGCFDAIELTDTGSTDGSIEVAIEWGKKIGTPVNIHHFDWVNDFSTARNYSFSHVKTDYVMWMDLDDVMSDKKAFQLWRDEAMAFADYWIAPYDYVVDHDGKPVVSFARERVLSMKINPKFEYFVHEGIVPEKHMKVQQAVTWRVKHRRTVEDQIADKARNLKIFESHQDKMSGRMWFYYGKEFFENQMPEKALETLINALARNDLELHDRILGFQYAAYAAGQVADRVEDSKKPYFLTQAINFAHLGLQLDPKRAEFHVILGETNIKLGRLAEALPHFAAAEHCLGNHAESKFQGPLFTQKNQYTDYPKIQKAKIYFHLGMLKEAEEEAKSCFNKFNTDEAKQIIDEINKIKPVCDIDGPKEKTADIVFSCPPQNAYEFDEELYKTKGMGGSETALIQMAKYIRKLTGRNVLVFNMRNEDLTAESGVRYISNKNLPEYFSKFSPALHVAWRHNIKLTNAPTVAWCHDLVMPTAESVINFEKIYALSPFHKNYLMAMQGIPEEKIKVTRNGIPVEKFNFERKPKNPNKIVWMSSPDRGLERAIKVTEIARAKFPELELHVYYGLENLYKYGMSELADKLKLMMSERPWVVYHGFTEQSQMFHEVSDAVAWCHPCNFIETFCITAIECLLNGIYPVTRKLGALRDTLKDAEEKGMAIMLDHDCVTEEEHSAYASALVDVLENKKWERVKLDQPEKFGWEEVAREWILEWGL